jgi:hypothetical protein
MTNDHDKLKQIVSEAMSKLGKCQADELGMLHQTAHTIRHQAIAAGEEVLEAEAERLLHAVEAEIDGRGGEQWLEAQAASTMSSLGESDIRNLSMTEIADQLANCRAFALITTSQLFKGSCQKLIERLENEIKHRGFNSKVEVFKSPIKYVVPSPSDIINGKSNCSEIPNN